MSGNNKIRYAEKPEKLVQSIRGTPEQLEQAFDLQLAMMPHERHYIVRTGENKTVDTIIRFKVRKIPIAFGIPMDEVCFSLWFSNLIGSAQIMPWDDIIIPQSTYLPDARNTVHQNFVEALTSKYLMMLDSDVLPDRKSVV